LGRFLEVVVEVDWFTVLKYGFLVSIALNAIIMPLLAIILIFGRPAFTYALAKLRGKDLLLALMRNGRFRIIPSDYKGLEITKNAAWLPKRPKIWNWGGVQVAVVHDGWGVLYDPEMELAVKALQEQKGIASYEELERRIVETDNAKRQLVALRKKLEGVEDGEEKEQLHEKILQLESWLEQYGIERTDPVVYRAFGVVTVEEIEDYFTDMYPSEIKAHIDENIADIAQQYVNPINKVGAYVVYGLLVMFGGMGFLYLLKGFFGG